MVTLGEKMTWGSGATLLQSVDVEGELEGGAQLQTHVFHHHVAAQQ